MAYQELDEGLIVFSASRSSNVLAMDNNYQPIARPSKIKIKDFMKTAKFFSPWGESDNLWPYTIMDALKGCAPAQVAIEILSTMMYGNGVAVYKENEKGQMVKVFNKEQRAWLRQINIQKYMMQAAIDYWTFGKQFGQPIRNKAKTGFGYVANISAPFNRLSPYDNLKGYIPTCYIHGSWNKLPDESECEKILNLPDFYADDIVKDNPNVDKFIMTTGKYTPGNIFYEELPWHALVRNGTLDIFPEIPKIRKRRIKDAMFVKYHVRINEMYFYQLCGGFDKGKPIWEGKTPAERKKIRNELYTQMDNKLSGSDNAFKSIYTPTTLDRNGAEVKLISIEKVETEVGESAAFDPDKMSNVADIFLAFTIPSAVANTVLSDSKSRGGGSDIREGNSSVVTRMPMHRDNLLNTVEWAMRNTMIGNTDQPLLAEDEFLDAENDLLTTLDNSANGVTSSTPTP